MSCTCKEEEKGCKGPKGRWICEHNSVLALNPEIEKYWSKKNETSASGILGKSTKKAILTCTSCNEDNEKIIGTISYSGMFTCDKCKVVHFIRKRPVITDPVENNLLSHHPEIINFWSPKNKVHPAFIKKLARRIIWLLCNVCNYEEEKKAFNIGNRICPYECPNCLLNVNSLAISCPDVIDFWSPKNPDTPFTISYGSIQDRILICKECNVEVIKKPTQLSKMGHYECYNCILLVTNVALLFPYLVEQVNDGTDLTQFTPGSDHYVEWKCQICFYIWTTMITSRTASCSGCKRCAGLAVVTYQVFYERMENKYEGKYTFPETFENFKLETSIVTGICSDHGETTKKRPHGHNVDVKVANSLSLNYVEKLKDV